MQVERERGSYSNVEDGSRAGRSERPADRDTQVRTPDFPFPAGTFVEYRSRTMHDQWISAKVLDFDERTKTYKLDVQPRAQVERVRLRDMRDSSEYVSQAEHPVDRDRERDRGRNAFTDRGGAMETTGPPTMQHLSTHQASHGGGAGMGASAVRDERRSSEASIAAATGGAAMSTAIGGQHIAGAHVENREWSHDFEIRDKQRHVSSQEQGYGMSSSSHHDSKIGSSNMNNNNSTMNNISRHISDLSGASQDSRMRGSGTHAHAFERDRFSDKNPELTGCGGSVSGSNNVGGGGRSSQNGPGGGRASAAVNRQVQVQSRLHQVVNPWASQDTERTVEESRITMLEKQLKASRDEIDELWHTVLKERERAERERYRADMLQQQLMGKE